MQPDELRPKLLAVGKDILTAFVVVAVIMLALYAYFGIWPPLVVVESGSMMHSDERSYVGVIDTGDMVFVKRIDGREDLVTYVEGEATGYSTYGAYGDVVIYRPNGLTENANGVKVVPIIHRLVLWLELNTTAVDPDYPGIDYANYSFDVPPRGIYGCNTQIVLENYGYNSVDLRIDLSPETGLLRYYQAYGREPHGGYITMGDHNAPSYDQPFIGSYEPVLPEWIIGKARGELPWVGIIKLKLTGGGGKIPANSWRNLVLSIALVLAIPLFIDFGWPRIRKRLAPDAGDDDAGDLTLATEQEGQRPDAGIGPTGAEDPGPDAGVNEPPGGDGGDADISQKD